MYLSVRISCKINLKYRVHHTFVQFYKIHNRRSIVPKNLLREYNQKNIGFFSCTDKNCSKSNEKKGQLRVILRIL